MRAAGRPEPGSPGVLKIKKISWLDRQRLRSRGRTVGRALAGRLAAWNQELRSPERILESLGLAEDDLGLLKALSGRPRGWHPYKADARAGAFAGRLAVLGLVCFSRWRRRVSLTGAGRVLLLLTNIDPKIKKARPVAGADS
ncbi:MAG: hypothetical protein LBC90_09795 [Candidatus Adiutrix sp.]|nr:hypothetical protein [Candidatus Adiutrix sp.]